MIPVTILAATAEKQSAKQRMLKRLREAGAISAAMPASLDAGDEHSKAALAAMLLAGTLREPRPGLYFIDNEAAKKIPRPGSGFVALVAILIIISFTVSLIAIASTAG
jgi:hypothetical protein